MFNRIMYPLRINCSYLISTLLHVSRSRRFMGRITAVWIISRFLNDTVYSYHGYFRFGSGFMPVFVKFYGSLMVHSYDSEKSRVLSVTV